MMMHSSLVFKIILINLLLIVIPGCCWRDCLKQYRPCKTCTDCGVVYENPKPERVYIDTQEEIWQDDII